MEEHSERVRVFVRIRPELEQDQLNSPSKNVKLNGSGSWSRANAGTVCVSAVDDKTVRLIPPDGVYGARKSVSAIDDKHYTFDQIFRETSTQEDVYEFVAENVIAAVRGYNSTIFAYGTTGSGKSYTMTGNTTAPGVIPRAITEIFKEIDRIASQDNDVYFLVRLSYVELYNDKFRNLLEHVSKNITEKAKQAQGSATPNISNFFSTMDDAETSFYDSQFGPSFAAARTNPAYQIKQHPGLAQRHEKIEVRENTSMGSFLSGQNLRIPVTNAVDAYKYVAIGNKHRAVGATNCNETSSRSHAILTFHVESRTSGSPGVTPDGSAKSELRLGKIHLVDLAGSERLGLSQAEGARMEETQNINSSLSALGDVLSALSKNALLMHNHSRSTTPNKRAPPVLERVPYRNSKLTHMLKDSLGGNSKTVMITTVRTGGEYFGQTSVSLEWSARAKTIRNKSLVNRNIVGDTGIQHVNLEIERLMGRIDERTQEFERLKEIQMKDAHENVGLKSRLRELQSINDMERQQLELQVSQVIHSQQGHIQSQRQKIQVLQSALQEELLLSQNKISEQEKEINWLKEALDKTQQAAQDVDEINKMKKVVSAWQKQAQATHKELSTVLQTAEELRAINTAMEQKIKQLEDSKRDLADEVNERTQETVELTNSLSQMMLEKQQMERTYSENRLELKGTLKSTLEKETEMLQRITALEAELRGQDEKHDSEVTRLQMNTAHLTKRFTDLEKEKADLEKRLAGMEKDKLELAAQLRSTMGAIEKKTNQVVEEAHQRVVQKDSQLKDAEIQSQLMNGEVNKLKSQLTEQQDMFDLKLESREKTIRDLETALNKELQFSSQQAAQILSMEGLVDGFRDKINNLKGRVKEYETQIASTSDKHIADQTEWVRELQAAKEKNRADRETLMADFERILKSKNAEFHKELESALNDWTELREQMEHSHQQQLAEQQEGFQAKEQQFQTRLAETEQKFSNMIDFEINENIRLLELKHAEAIAQLSAEHGRVLGATVRDLEDKHAIAITEINADHSRALAEKIRNVEARHDELVAQLNAEHRRVVAEKDHGFQELLAGTVAELKAQHTKSLEEKVRTLEAQHADSIAELNAQHARALGEKVRSLEAHHAGLLNDYSSEHSRSLDDGMRRLKAECDKVLATKLAESAAQAEEALRAALSEQRIKFEREISALRAALEDDSISSMEQLRAATEAEKEQIARNLQERHQQTMAALRAELENDSTRSLEQLRAATEAEKEQIARNLQERHQQAIAALRAELENDSLRSVEEVLSSAEKEKKTALAELARKKAAELEVVEAQYQAQIEELQSLMKKQRVDLETSHEAKLEQLNTAHREYQTQMDRKIVLFKQSSEEKTEAAIADSAQRLESDFRKKVEDFARREREMIKLNADTLRSVEEKYELDVANAVLKERMRLSDKHKLEVEGIKADAQLALQRALSAAENRHQDVLLESTESERAQLIEQHQRKIQSLQEEARLTLSDALESQKLDLESRHNTELQILRNKMTSEQLKIETELRSTHSLDIDELTAKHRREVETLRRDLESALLSSADEKDREIAQFREQINLMQVVHREELSTALDAQQRQLLDRHKSELDRFRSEKQETETLHQEEMSSALATHLAEIARQRRQIEATHSVLVDSLNEELAVAKERCNQALSLVAVKEGEGSRVILDQKAKFDEQLSALKNERDALHRNELEALQLSHDAEVQKLRAAAEKLRTRHESEIQTREAEHLEDINRQVSALKEKFVKEAAESRRLHEESLSTQLNELSSRHKLEMDKVLDEQRQQTVRSSANIAEALSKVAELTEALAEKSSQFEGEKSRLIEENKLRISRIESRYHSETSTLETSQQELESRLKAKYKQQLAAQKEEFDAELLKQNADAKAILIKRDGFFQQEVAVLKSALAKREADHSAEAKELEDQIAELKRKSLALSDKMREMQTQFEEEKRSVQEEQEELARNSAVQQKAEMQRIINEMNERNNREVDRLETQLEQAKQEFRSQHQSVLSDSSQSRQELENSFLKQIAHINDLLASERMRATQLKQSHLQEVESLQQRFELERAELVRAKEEAVNHSVRYSDAEMARTIAELKERHAQDVGAWQSKVDGEKQLAVSQMTLLSAQHKSAVQELESRHSEQVEQLEFEAEKERSACRRLRDQHANQLQEVERQAELEKSALAKGHEDVLRLESNRRDQELKRLKDMHALEMEDIQNRFDAEAQFLRDRLQILERDAQNKVHDVELVGREQIGSLTALLSHEKTISAQLREQHKVETASLEALWKEKLATAQSEQARLVLDNKIQMVALVAQNKRDLQDALDVQQQRLRVEHQESSEALAQELRQNKVVSDRMLRDLEHRLAEAQALAATQQSEYELKVSHHADEMTYLREKFRRDLDAEKARLTDNFGQTIQVTTESAKKEIAAHEEELQALHDKELQLFKAQNRAEVHALVDAKVKENEALQRRLEDQELAQRDLQRQMTKAEAQRELLMQELDNLKAERAVMLDNMGALEVEVIEHGRAKFEARVLAEREKIDKSYKDAFAEVRAEVAARVEENRALQLKISQGEVEVASMRAVAKFAEEERERVENMFKSILTEREAAHEADLKRSLEAQHEELQGGYLKLIQQQVDSLMVLIQKQATQHSSSQQVDDLQNKFMTLVQDLPDLWKLKHGSFMAPNNAASTPERPSRAAGSPVKTPIFLLANTGSTDTYDTFSELDRFKKAKASGKSLPWSSPSLRSSPSDQLIAAILDGDVQGIRAVVRSKGEDLTADFWRELTKPALPLHRAVSGLHFHGSEKLLVATLETLTQLGADINATDHAGNSVLHKAIQVCTSKSIAAVVQTLLTRGCNASARNKDGDSALHAECKRVRTASVDVIEALIAAGADPNCKNLHNGSITPLTLVLLRGAASTVTGTALIGQGEESTYGLHNALAGRGLESSIDVDSAADYDSHTAVSVQSRGHSLFDSSHTATRNGDADMEKARVAGRRVWIKAAEMLVKSGAHWDSAWRTPRGCSQLHLFLAAFPPSREDSSTYRALLKSALESGLSLAVEDDRGRSALFVLCEQMASISSEVCPDATRLMHIVLDGCGENGVGTADRSGRTVFDIEEKVPHSCLSACRQILVDSSNQHRHMPLRSTTSRLPPAQPHSSHLQSHSNDWELERPRVSGGIASSLRDHREHREHREHTSSSHSTGSHKHVSHSRYSEVVPKRKPSSGDSYASSDNNSLAGNRSRGNSYLLEADEDDRHDLGSSASSLRLSGLRNSLHR